MLLKRNCGGPLLGLAKYIYITSNANLNFQAMFLLTLPSWFLKPATHLAIFFADRTDVEILKAHVIKSPNLMGWLYWRFAAINVENRGNGHTWRMPANLIADI